MKSPLEQQLYDALKEVFGWIEDAGISLPSRARPESHDLYYVPVTSADMERIKKLIEANQ